MDLSLLLGIYLAVTLIALSAVDIASFTLPDRLNLALAAGGVLATVTGNGPSPLDTLLGGVLGGGLTYLVLIGYRALRGREGLGLGDVKLAAAGGLWTGALGLGPMMVVATVAALLAILVQSVVRRRRPVDEPIPFGPFLSIGIFVAWLMGSGWLDL